MEQLNENPDSNAGAGEQDDLKVDELGLLKTRAKLLGITFSNNIGVDALREKIAAKMTEDAAAHEAATNVSSASNDQSNAPVPEGLKGDEQGIVPAPVKKLTLRQLMIRDNMKLVRIRVVNLDPKKKEWPGEFLTVANEHLGTVTKYIPFGEATDNGYHVPYCIYKMLKNRKFLSIRTFKDKKNGNQIKVEQRWANEFAIEVLDPLTPDELAKLATAQTAAGTLD